MADYKSDIRKYKPTVGGTDVKDTKMLKGEGAMTPAQNDTNETVPFSTGKAPGFGKCGAEATH